MVIVAPGIARNPSARRNIIADAGLFDGIRLRGVVVQRDDDQAARAIERLPWIRAALIAEVIHFARMSALQPGGILREFRKSLGRNDGAEVTPEFACLLADPACAVSQIHGAIMPSTWGCS